MWDDWTAIEAAQAAVDRPDEQPDRTETRKIVPFPRPLVTSAPTSPVDERRARYLRLLRKIVAQRLEDPK